MKKQADKTITQGSQQIGIRELYAEDAVAADLKVFGRRSDPLTRRGFLSGLGAMGALLGGEIVFGRYMPAGLIPAAFAETTEAFTIPGKHPGLTILNDRPINAETPVHLLDDAITPADKLFVRNNGIPPVNPDPQSWSLTIDGESVLKSKTYSIAELKAKFETVSYQLTLECGGNGRSEFNPPAKGNQWGNGAVGCPKWTGVRLADVLNDCGIKSDAVYVAYHGADTHISGAPDKEPISRGVPIAKALQQESMIAWALNDEDIPLMNGYPLRMVIGGWPASTSGKWLERISIRNKVHDGAKMLGHAYRVPCEPVAPGSTVLDEDMCIIHQMPVKSLVTYPKSGISHKLDKPLAVRGHAWAGDAAIDSVYTSIDFGQSWQQAKLNTAVNHNAWQRWLQQVSFPKKGYYELWVRATDTNGHSQPMVLPGWNPKGYLNNACHRIAIKVV
ncbi:sulfite oxidase [Dasania marina]|uniref:sulfite oxidase n=1 Tax=Dasania marina TaxID=471499 RepID=UPI000374ABF5|nr:sulfite oxidase [Dasania marina]